MKKLLSVLLCAAMLVSALVFVVSAEEPTVDKAMLLDDICIPDDTRTGKLGYIVNVEKENDYGAIAFGTDDTPYPVQDANGIGVAFDINMLSYSLCSHLVSDAAPNDYRHIEGFVFTFSNADGWNGIAYDAKNQEIQIGNYGSWPPSVIPLDQSNVLEKASCVMNPGEWHRLYVQAIATEVYVYVDGEQVLYHDFTGGYGNRLERTFLMLWPSHCRMMIDNMIIGTDEYDDTLGTNTEERVAANYDPDNGVKNLLFVEDFNDATAPVYDHTEQEPRKVQAKDEKGKEITEIITDPETGKEKEVPVYEYEMEEDGVTYKLDGEGNKIYKQATDDDGNLLWDDVFYYKVDGEVIRSYSQKHAGFEYGGHGINVPYKAVDKATYAGMIRDVEDALISFADTKGIEGQTFTAEITTKGGFTEATGLVLSVDPIFTVQGIENVPDGVTVTLDGGRVGITLPENYSGKIGDLVLKVDKERTVGTGESEYKYTNYMGQSDKYRYGFLVSGDTFVGSAGVALDADAITIDGGFAFTSNFTKGDVNGDGKINARDVTLLMKYIIVMKKFNKGETLSAAEQKVIDSTVVKAADCRGDDVINARDVQHLMKFIVNGEWPEK